MLELILKSEEKIEASLETIDEDGEELQHTGGVLYKSEILTGLRNMHKIVSTKVFKYNNKYALGCLKVDGTVTYISPKWVYKMVSNDISVINPTNKATSVGDNYLKIKSKYLLNIDTLELVDKEEVSLCLNCATPITDNTLDGLCEKCYNREHYDVESYNYKPTPKFIGKQAHMDVLTPIWYGIELEYGVNSKLPISKLVHHNELYLKSDSSIYEGDEGGVEVVTHPHSFKSLMAKGWVDILSTLDVNDHKDNGCHIHVSRTAWVDDKHYALTYYLMYEMGKVGLLETLGGRAFTDYCKLGTPNEPIHKLTKDGGKADANRSLWLNEKNTHTIEFRFFSGTKSPDTLRSYVQLLDSIIKYTKYHKKTVTVPGLMKYIEKYKGKYGQLDDVLTTYDEIHNIKVVFRQPKIKTYKDINKLPIGLLSRIVGVTKTSGKTYNNISRVRVVFDILKFNREDYGGYNMDLTRVASIKVEV